jgi:uncharacterized protein YjcR
MAKKPEYEALAKRYYIESQMPISGIAKRLNITEKTLHDWKKEGNWDAERSSFISGMYQCNSSMYNLVRMLTEDAIRQFQETGQAPDASTLNFIAKMSDKLGKMKAFEGEITMEHMAKVNRGESQDKDNIVDKINRLILGEDA